MKAKTFKIVAFSCAAVMLAIVLALSVAISIPLLRGLLDKFVVGYKDGAGSSAARADGAALSEQIQGEGTVLVKNDKPTESAAAPLLPMSIEKVPKVNVFGWAATDWVVSGSGSGQVKNGKIVDFFDALELAGVEYNTELTSMYESFRSRREKSEHGGATGGDANNKSSGSLHSFNYEFSRLYEPSISNKSYYSDAILNGALAYSDTAIVVIGRVSGESNDSPKVQYKRTDGSGIKQDNSRTYLEISTEEEELLTYVGANYENVIVLINSTNVMELGFLESIEGLDACLVVATTGSHGTRAIPRLLYSDLENEGFSAITPSGKLADTYAYDLSTSSTYVDTGSGNDTTHFYTDKTYNGKKLYPLNVQHTNGSTNVDYEGVAYQDYRESVYVGYKWYETADEMGFWTSDFAKAHWKAPNGEDLTGYKDVVQYPFGYGLSYTQFTWNITHMGFVSGQTVDKDAEFEIGVTVTNTGSVPGQDVVELYYSAPYKEGGIEKASVNLLAFGKTTQVLKAGESEYVPLKFKVSDMASYDSSSVILTNGGYVLEGGTYTLTLRTDSHTLADDKIVSDGDSEHNSATMTCKISKDTRVLTESENRFTGTDTTDGVAIDGNSDGSANITYLSRSKFAETFPIAFGANRSMTEKIKSLNLYSKAMADDWDENHDDGNTYTFGDKNSGDLVYENGQINEYGKKLGLDYNASEWEDLLNRISKSEMQNLVLHGYTKTSAVSSIGKPETLDLDGPNQIGSFSDGITSEATGFSSIVLAQSWNLELAYSMGLAFGNECISYGIQGWYGPGVNVHRSPFGGRNYEYYSEDAYMSGMMCARVVTAAKNKGVFCYLKHICLYESESGRDGMYTWVTEQALREIYLRPFEIAVKEGGSNAIMTSYGRIGAVWTGGSEALLTEVVRGEWGFQGAFLTDYADHHDFMNGDQMIRAGGDLWMDGVSNNGSFKLNTNSNAYNKALRDATKNIVYMWLNSLATNAKYNDMIASGEINDSVTIPTAPVLNFRWYIPVIVVADLVLAAGAAVLIFFGIIKKDKVTANGGDSAETSEPIEPVVESEPQVTEQVAQEAAPETPAETPAEAPAEESAAQPAEESKEQPAAEETPAPKKKPRAKKTPPPSEE